MITGTAFIASLLFKREWRPAHSQRKRRFLRTRCSSAIRFHSGVLLREW